MEAVLLNSRIKDAVLLSEKQNKIKAVGFLSESEAAQAKIAADTLKAKYTFYGGFEDALRRMFIALPEWASENDAFDFIVPVTFTFRDCYKLSHRDFLGTLMSLGIVREKIGDILVESGRAVVFLSKDISSYITEQTEKVGGVGVVLTEGYTLPLPQKSALKSFCCTVSSPRLDSIVGALVPTSREKAKDIIANSFVSVNSLTEEKITQAVKAGDRISIRGHGRYIIDECENYSKKGRIVLKYSKYV